MPLELTAIRLATALIPAKKLRKKVRDRWLAAARARRLRRLEGVVKARYAKHEERCRAKMARGERLRVAFLACDAAMFSAESVFALMREDPRFECFIAVAPRVSRGKEFLRATLAKTLDVLRARYGAGVRALCGPGGEDCRGLDGEADVVFTSILYEDQAPACFAVEKMSAFALVATISYGYSGLFRTSVEKLATLPNAALSWRLALSNAETLAELARLNPALAANARVCGYAKMDRYAGVEEAVRREEAAAPRRRKKVVLCPHHTIGRDSGGLQLSTFMRFADFYLRLPAMYPQIDFVFRPHPLLFVRLRTPKWWGEERTARWEREMEAHPNVEFQRGGDYFETFARSDALVHDCGSFLAEYFYTGKPQCYLLESGETEKRQFLPFASRLLDAAQRAFSEKDVTDFIDRTVLGGDDPAEEARRELAGNTVCVCHPHASRRVVDMVCEGIAGAGKGNAA